jgi:DNA-binding LytR/AlgR family response regulator
MADSGLTEAIKVRLILKEKADLFETEVEIRFREKDEEVENLISAVNSARDKLIGIKDNGDIVPVSYSKILYFEAVDRYVFAYTSANVYKIRNTLYELEDMCRTKSFVRISKSQIVNLNAVRKISPDDGRKLRLLLANGETVIVSRGFVGDLRKTIGMKGDA